MKRGVRFIMLTISSVVCERTESMAGGREGVVVEEASWAFGLVEMGKGVSVDGGRGLDELKSSGSSCIRDIFGSMEETVRVVD